MDFIKKHYEKVILGAVLLGLAVAVGFLPFKIGSEKQKLDDMRQTLTNPKVKALTNLDLSGPDATIKRLAAPATINFSAPNKLFNPMPWQKAADGHLIKLDDSNIGPRAVSIAKLTPLSLKLTLDSVTVLDNVAKYIIGVEKEAAPVASQRSKKQTYCSLNNKNDTFALREIQGPPDNPTNLVVELNDTGERANLNKDKGFQRVDGYMADLKYDPEKKTWRNQRVGSSINFNGEDYNVVAINQSEVVLSAKANQKKWTIKYNPSIASP